MRATLVLPLILMMNASQLHAQNSAKDGFETLNLLVILNGRDTGIVSEFRLAVATGDLSVTRDDLADAGIAAPPELGPQMDLRDIQDLLFDYDQASQTVILTVPSAMLVPRRISAQYRKAPAVAQPGWGLVQNYQLSGNMGEDSFRDGFQASSLYAGLDQRASTPFGVFANTGAVGTRGDAQGTVRRRYESSFVHVAQDRMVTLTLGDFASTGADWTRPIRMGGVQAMRDFSLNPSFVTDPSVSYSGVAVLPSGVDVFVNNVRAWSGDVDAGPFTLSDVPMVTTQGEAVFVLRDPSGQERVSRVPFYTTQNLLRKGVADFALQAGYPRENYGVENFAYGRQAIASGGLRYGITDRLTLNGHAEGTAGLFMLGGGLDTTLFHKAELGLAAAQSSSDDGQGQLLDLQLRTRITGVDLRAGVAASFGEFEDLAARLTSGPHATGDGTPGFAPVQLQQTLSLSVPLQSVNGYAALSYIHVVREAATDTILSGSFAQTLGSGTAALRVNAFKDISEADAFGISLGLSIPLGNHTSANVQTARMPSGVQTQASLSRHAGHAPGDMGYRVTAYGQDAQAAGVTYQSRYSRSDLTLRSADGAVSANAATTGAVVLAGGGLFLANRIEDGYAVADVGVPGVTVSMNNRPAAVTGWHGKALVSDLRAYEVNRISIDPLDLPENTTTAATAIEAVPARGSGVTIAFGGSTGTSAMLVLRDATGAFLPPGTPIALNGAKATIPMGYDGEVWLKDLNAENRIVSTLQNGTCTANFAFQADPTGQTYIEGVMCQ